MEEEVTVQTESLELSAEEVAALTTGEGTTETKPQLPSDTVEVDFSKYEGVSREDIIRQMEQLQSGAPKTEEQTPEAKPKAEETKEEPIIDGVTTEIFNEFAEKYEANGGKLTDEDYAALEAKGISRQAADDRIGYEIYKNEQALKKGLAPYGDASDIPEAIEWARANWTQEQRETFNKAVEGSEGAAQYAIVGGLLQQFAASKGKADGTPIHGKGSTPAPRNTGYATKSDYVKDANNPAYDRDPSYRAQVEAKLAATDMNKWYTNVPKGV